MDRLPAETCPGPRAGHLTKHSRVHVPYRSGAVYVALVKFASL